MASANWNRSGRKSGGSRPAKIQVGGLGGISKDEFLVMQQREKIRAEFGEAGVKRFDEMLAKEAVKMLICEICKQQKQCGDCIEREAPHCKECCDKESGGRIVTPRWKPIVE